MLDGFELQRAGLVVAVGADLIGQALAGLGWRRLDVYGCLVVWRLRELSWVTLWSRGKWSETTEGGNVR